MTRQLTMQLTVLDVSSTLRHSSEQRSTFNPSILMVLIQGFQAWCAITVHVRCVGPVHTTRISWVASVRRV